MRIDTYTNNMMFSYVKGTDKPLKRTMTESKKCREMYKTYNPKGFTKENNVGQYYDQRI